eukprot:gb/GEZJ01003315.1/.p2 GENE.gb/GEZJ01003315.1/~~gb/GEZJ01003315.1/.p2  ORF type:complete len:118 (+),score=13.04 gb/GEZJ01003315.1/:423-776(+)
MDSLRGRQVHWLGVRHTDYGKMFGLQDSQILRLTEPENTLLDGVMERWKQSTGGQAPKEVLLKEARTMKESQTKFEMEALAANSATMWERSGLLEYVLLRIFYLETPNTQAKFTCQE